MFLVQVARFQISGFIQHYSEKSLLPPKVPIGGIQVLRHQRGGWVGWPNDDV